MDDRDLPAPPEMDVVLAWRVCTLVDAVLTAAGADYHAEFAVAPATLDRAKEAILRRCLGRRAGDGLDPYEVAAWYGFHLAGQADDRRQVALLATIQVMAHFLRHEAEGVTLDDATRLRLFRLATAADGDALDRTGLHLAFHLAARAQALRVPATAARVLPLPAPPAR